MWWAVVLFVLISSNAFAQSGTSSTAEIGLATAAGHELNVSLSSYTYREPDAPGISIRGPKIGVEYTGTLLLNERHHWFAQADARGLTGRATYRGACAPWLIRPNRASPNGYELGLGSFSPCSESGDSDWHIEGRGLI